MSEVKHTPGPWLVREGFLHNKWEVYPTRDGPPDFGEWSDLAEVTGDYGPDDDEGAEGLANARLIASAPDMLVAIHSILPKLRKDNDDPEGVDWSREIEAFEAAIAKAEGR